MSQEPSSREAPARRLWAPPLAVVDREASPSISQALVARLVALSLLMVMAGAAAAYLVASLGPTMRAARTELVYHLESDQSSDFLRTDRQHTTQLVLIRSRAVLGPVAQDAGLSYDELADDVSASVVEGSEVIRIQVADRSGDRARELAGAVGDRYLEVARRSTGLERRAALEEEIVAVDGERRSLEDTLERLQQERMAKAFTDEGNIPPPTSEERLLEARIDRLDQRRDELGAQQSDIVARQTGAPTVERITAAYELPDPVSPRPARAAAFGACAALVAACAVVAVAVRRSSTSPGP